jgi:hypothetical protein
MASPKLLLFFYVHFTLQSCNTPVIKAFSLPENDMQALAPVLGQGHAEDLDFRG